MLVRSREEIKSYENLRAQSVQELLTSKKRSVIEGRDASTKLNILSLPFEPVWYIPLMLVSGLTVLVVLYESAPHRFVFLNDTDLFFYTFDALYAIDVVLMFICKFSHLSNVPVIRPTVRPKIILLVEFLSVIPFEFLSSFEENASYLWRLNRVLRIPRLFHHLYYKHSMVKVNTWLKVAMFFFLVSIGINLNYTGVYHLLCSTDRCQKDDSYATKLYLASAAMLTSHGLGEVPETFITWQLMSVIVSYTSFYAVFGVCLAYIINDFTRSQTHKYKFKHNILVVHEQFLAMNVPIEIINVCIEFYHIFWQNRHGFSDDRSFFKILPAPMYQQIVLDVCWIPLKHSKLLKNMDQPFLRFLSTFVQQKFMLKNQLVYQKNHLKKGMVFIASGVIQIISEQDGETPIMSFSAGTCLGESSLVISYNSRNTVRCKEYCEVQLLSKEDFIRAIKKYPNNYRILRKQINKRYEEAKELNMLSKHFNATSEAEGKDYFTITWIKNTLHKLMAKDDEKKSKHEYQNIYLRYEMHEHKIHSMLFSAKNLDMLVITERLELDSDSIFLKMTWPFIFQPESLFLVFWEKFIILLAVFACILIPYYSFNDLVVPLGMRVCYLVITIIWILDFIIQIFTAVKTKDELVITIKGIFAYRLQHSGFIADIVSLIPIEVFSCILVAHVTDQTGALLRLNRTLKIWRIVRMLFEWENRLHSNIMFVGWVKFLFLIVYLVFIVSCALYAWSCSIGGKCDYYKGEYHQIFVATQMVTGIGLMSKYDREYSYNIVYLITMNVGYLVILLMYVNFSAAYILEHYNLLKVQKTATDFSMIAKAKKITFEERVMDYIRTQWLDNRGTRLMSTRSKTADMPESLFKVMREAAFADILRKQRFFKRLDDYIITDVCVIAKPVTLPPNEIVAYAGDLSNEFYIIVQGFCKDYTYGRILAPGDSFNIMEACLGMPVLQTVATVTFCKLMCIPYNKMKHVYANHQDFDREVAATVANCGDIVRASKKVLASAGDQRWYNEPSMTDNKSRYVFPKVLELNSVAEYEYYVPFDRQYFLGWTRFFLMKTTFFPVGKFLYCWEIQRCILAILSSFLCITPHIGSCPLGECYVSYFMLFLDIMAWLDIYIRMHVCYYNEIGILVVHPFHTAHHYITHGFMLDLLGAIPAQLFVTNTNAYRAKIILLLHSNRLLQIHRFIQLKSSLYFDRLIPYTKIYVFGYIPILLVTIAVWGSLLVNLTCDLHPTIPESATYAKGGSCDEDDWISGKTFTIPIEPFEIISMGLYFAASVVTTVGMQGFEIQNFWMGMTTTIMAFTSVFYITYIMANIISHFSSSSPVLLTYQEAMRNLKKFMSVKRVPTRLQQKIIDHYELKWSKEKGKDIFILLKKFHFPLKQDLLFHLFGERVYQHSKFGEKSKGFYRNVIMSITHQSILKGGTILAINDINKYLYIIFSGMVDVVGADGTIFDSLSVGAMFGNLDGLPYTRQTANIMARSHVELLAIQSVDFYAVLDKYTDLKWEFRTSSVLNVYYFPSKKTKTRANVEVLQAAVDEVKFKSKFVLNPNNKRVKTLWWLTLHISSYICVLLEAYQFSLRELHPYFTAVQYVSDAFFFLYIYMKYLMAYEDEMGNMVTNRKQVFCHHIHASKKKWRCYLDIFSMLPLDLIMNSISGNNHFMAWIRINRLTRVVNILEFFNYKQQLLATNHTLNRLEFVFVWTTLLLHGMTCFLLLICCETADNMNPPLKCEELTTPKDKFVAYIGYLYIIVNIFTRTAQQKYRPDGWIVALVLVGEMIIMTIAVAVFFSQIFLIIYKNYYTRIVFANTVDHLNHFIDREEVSNVLVERIQIYIQRLWMRHRGVLFPQLLEDAPNYLSEAILNASYSEHIANHPVFFKCHVDLQRQIVAKLRDNIYFPGDYIAFQEDINETMFFIHRGEIIATTEDEDNVQRVFRTYRQGQVFGVLQGLTLGVAYKHSYRASTISVVLSLKYNSWSYMLEFYPASTEIIKKHIHELRDRYQF